jgi:hypothetical protein
MPRVLRRLPENANVPVCLGLIQLGHFAVRPAVKDQLEAGGIDCLNVFIL